MSRKFTLSALFFAAVVSIGLTACRKQLNPLPEATGNYATTYSELFELFWNTMNTSYLYWDVDTTDWDAVHTRYQPLFAKLNINNPDDQRTSVAYFRDMLSGTRDGHLVLSFYPAAIVDSVLYPRQTQNELTINHLQTINPTLLPGEQQRSPDYYVYNYYDLDRIHYLDSGSAFGTYSAPNFGDINVLQGTIKGSVLYFAYDAQGLTVAVEDPGSNLLKDAYNRFIQALQHDPSVKGAIVDMRGGYQGGYISDGALMASAMIDKPALKGTTRYKSGPGRLDYTPWTPTYIQPATGAKAIRVPLIILTDVLTFSGAEYVTAALHAVPGAVTVGTATRGGSAAHGGVKTIQGGFGSTSFYLERYTPFMDLTVSPSAFRDKNGAETIWGLKPDYEVPFDTVAIHQGRDPQLEKALSLLK